MRRYRLSALALAAWAFIFSAAIAGQIVFHSQGDTSAISFRYGLLYVLYAGVPGAVRGEYPFIVSLSCQLIVAGFFYWLGYVCARVGWVSAAVLTIALCVWLFLIGPEIG